MVMRLVADGARIKELRTGGVAELPQKTLAGQFGISERQLRRVENQNLEIPLPVLERIAKALGVAVEDVSFGLRGPQLVSGEKTPALAASAVEEPETMHLPRHTTASLAPVAGAQALYELAKHSMEIVPHVLVDVAPAQMEMIEECLEILKVISEQEWSCGYPVASDAHDDADFPEASRRRRLAELFVLIKGHDIRIVADSEHYEYPLGATPPEGRCTFDRLRLTEAMTSWPRWHVSSNHLVVAFAPPRGEYEEERVTVPFDRGCEKVLPYKPIGPFTERCEACCSYFFELRADEPGGPMKSRCRSCGWTKDDAERAHYNV
jgi:transcriptional regulator with XRE-family HTH domain